MEKERAHPLQSRRMRSLTAHGTHRTAFGPTEWTLVALAGGIWGSSFLFIEEGLDAFGPGVITFSRLTLGAVTLALLRGSHRRVEREDWRAVVLLGVLWMSVPLLLFPVAQQWVESSVAGMINGSMPIFTAVWASILLRHPPGRRQVVGIATGFVGVVAIAAPNAFGADASPGGVALLVLAVAMYGFSANIAVPLQQKYGALPVTFRAQLVAMAVSAPFAALGVPGSSWSWSSAAAMLPLGVLSSGVAFIAMTTLVGRAGAARGSIAIYFTPVVAVILGVLVLDERLHALALAGLVLVIAGAWLTSRGEDEVVSPDEEIAAAPPAT